MDSANLNHFLEVIVVNKELMEDVLNVIPECSSVMILNVDKLRLWDVLRRTIEENALTVLQVNNLIIVFRFRFE